MINAQIDANGYFTGEWTSVGGMENTVPVDVIPISGDTNKLRSYRHENGAFVFDEERYRLICEKERAEKDALKAEQEIKRLKAELDATDYKIIKCYEYSLAGAEPPYDAASLHKERQAVRDCINRLGGNI